ncbi:MAG: hypothetical protein IPL55_14855 [Saprospiraceae bacterium]|nr:hypothetical protein [Saprospiraceae bacterium]
MKAILQINAVIEILAGFVLLFNPQLLLYNANPELQGIAVAKLYGICAFCFGLITHIVSKQFVYNLMFKRIILVVITFHFVVALYFFSLYNQSITPHPGAAILHASLAGIFILIYLKNMQKFSL